MMRWSSLTQEPVKVALWAFGEVTPLKAGHASLELLASVVAGEFEVVTDDVVTVCGGRLWILLVQPLVVDAEVGAR